MPSSQAQQNTAEYQKFRTIGADFELFYFLYISVYTKSKMYLENFYINFQISKNMQIDAKTIHGFRISRISATPLILDFQKF